MTISQMMIKGEINRRRMGGGMGQGCGGGNVRKLLALRLHLSQGWRLRGCAEGITGRGGWISERI